MAKNNVTAKSKPRDIFTYRFYFELVLLGIAAVLLVGFSNKMSSLSGILSFPESVTPVFIATSVALLLAIAYKVLATVFKTQWNVLPANFILGWAIGYFAALGILFVETKFPQLMFYSQTMLVYTVALIVFAVLEVINFLSDGQLYRKVFAGLASGKK